ncbi:MAG: hypothetical protein U0V02_04600 [Anaerolineales bacterium]
MFKNWKQITGEIIGASIILTILFANQLGLDTNSSWGIRRYILLTIGILALSISVFYRRENFIGRAFHTYTGQLYLSIGILNITIVIVYIWVASMGLWTTWLNRTSYYDLLATAFSHGQIALEVLPDPALLELESLYELNSREGIPFLWDASLYKGKYYLYWGPAPALLLTLFKLGYTQPIGDKALTFIFIIGILIFITLLILEIWRNYFPKTPRWAILLGIAFASLANPLLFVLMRGLIYDAAIISGQFFLIGGLYWLFISFNRSSSKYLFFLAGLFFTLAVGSRTNLALTILFLSVVVLIWTLKTQKNNAFLAMVIFSMPLLIGAVGYAAYNYARFGSITEFGLQYQLTIFNLNTLLGKTFSLAYIPQNLYMTLFNPFEIHPRFPYIFGAPAIVPAWLTKTPQDFNSYPPENITGILVGSPFLIFSLFARPNKNIHWIYIALAGSCLLTFFTLQVFFFTTMRYLLDLTPVLSLLAVVGFWQSLEFYENRPVIKSILSVACIILVMYSIMMSGLLAISGDIKAFSVFSTDLLAKLRQIFPTIR